MLLLRRQIPSRSYVLKFCNTGWITSPSDWKPCMENIAYTNAFSPLRLRGWPPFLMTHEILRILLRSLFNTPRFGSLLFYGTEWKEFWVFFTSAVVRVCVSLDCQQHWTPNHNLVHDHQTPLLSVGMHGPLLAENQFVKKRKLYDGSWWFRLLFYFGFLIPPFSLRAEGGLQIHGLDRPDRAR